MLTFEKIIADSRIIRDELELRHIILELQRKGLVERVDLGNGDIHREAIYVLTERGRAAARRSQ